MTEPGPAARRAGELVAALTREVADFPTPGIAFKDVTPVFADAAGLAAVTVALAQVAAGVELVAGIDARGFLLAGAVAERLGVGALAVRKGGKLPPPVHSESYQLEYGSAVLEIPAEGIPLAGRRVVIVDDVLATGGTLAATHRLLQHTGADVIAAGVVLELTDLGGRAAVAPLEVHSLHRI
ncbi:adenine phosphoribosyltransferase [Mycobacterium sp. M1]|uniref:Adenine phosphoribosyltransferase n=1 Tax=Mycolicibacter acidiphilus TaxID=2835306 RepID=A0ABS5RGN5_9MYCO|nr:adenine phosphoribosyltransferase [Mycolicibacter acidiphilus]MBS9532129.1 adenine phosphoribosyltransferase [Mycolicibacter acidiphilus]